jgi:hypothetical protein
MPDIYVNQIGSKRLIPDMMKYYKPEFIAEVKQEQQEYKKIYSDFHNNLEAPAIDNVHDVFNLWEMVREFDSSYNAVTNMSTYAHINSLLTGKPFSQAKDNFAVFCKSIQRYGREKLNGEINYNQFMCMSMLNRLPTTGHGADQWIAFKQRMLTHDNLTPALIEQKGLEVAEFIDSQKQRPDAAALATQTAADFRKMRLEFEEVKQGQATALAAETQAKNNLQNTLNQRAAAAAAAEKRRREDAGWSADANAAEYKPKRGKWDDPPPCSHCGVVGHFLRNCTAAGAEEKRKEVAAKKAVKGAGGGKDNGKGKTGDSKGKGKKGKNGKK